MAFIIYTIAVVLISVGSTKFFGNQNHRGSGMDENFAKKQEWWEEVSRLVLTDDETTTALVENVYLNVCKAKLKELDHVMEELSKGEDPDDIRRMLERRANRIRYYAQLDNLKEVKSDS